MCVAVARTAEVTEGGWRRRASQEVQTQNARVAKEPLVGTFSDLPDPREAYASRAAMLEAPYLRHQQQGKSVSFRTLCKHENCVTGEALKSSLLDVRVRAVRCARGLET